MLTALLIGHTNSSAVCRVRIAITWVVEIKDFFREIQPALFVKIFGVILPDHHLEITLPCRDHIVQGLSRRSEVVGIIMTLFVKINMNMRHPLIINFNARLTFLLYTPGP